MPTNLLPPLSAFEERVLYCVIQLDNSAYGLSIMKLLGSAEGARQPSLASVHMALGRLEEKGCIISWEGHPLPERGNRGRRYWELTQTGRNALIAAARKRQEEKERNAE